MNEIFPLDRAPDAYDRMMSGKHHAELFCQSAWIRSFMVLMSRVTFASSIITRSNSFVHARRAENCGGS